MAQHLKKQQWSWAFYDWANSAFATTVMAGFFPVFFKKYWAADLTAVESTFWLGTINSIASILVVLLAPLIGAIADRGGHRKKLLLSFAFLGVLMCIALFFLAEGLWPWALMVYGFGVVGFSGANVCYDAILVDITNANDVDRVSALGFGLGYLGGAILFALNVLMVQYPDFFGLASSAAAVKLAFFSVAVWWSVFSLPVLLFIPENTAHAEAHNRRWDAFKHLWESFQIVRAHRTVSLFLLAYWLYIDGVDTIVRMAVDYGLAIGLESSDLMLALLLTQVIGFPAAIFFGRLGERFGAKTGIQISLGVYIGVIIWAGFIEQAWEFYALAAAIGLVQGGVQALSRSLYTRLIPNDNSATFFGFYNMLGKFAAVLGPIMVGVTVVLTENSRYGLFSILILMIAGSLLLRRVQPEAG